MSGFARGHLAMLAFSLLIAGSFSFGTRVANLMDPAALMGGMYLAIDSTAGERERGLDASSDGRWRWL